MTDAPRSLYWFRVNGMVCPQLIFEPRVGSLDMKPMTDPVKIDPSEFHLTLDELATRYPAPQES